MYLCMHVCVCVCVCVNTCMWVCMHLLLLFSGVSVYGNPVFVLDRRREKLIEKDVNMAEEGNESMVKEELLPHYSETSDCNKESSA